MYIGNRHSGTKNVLHLLPYLCLVPIMDLALVSSFRVWEVSTYKDKFQRWPGGKNAHVSTESKILIFPPRTEN